MICLLDIDGVMVPLKGWKVIENLDDDFPPFTDEAVEALQMLKPTEIILTTSHRFRFSIDKWKQIFERRGIVVEKISRVSDLDKFDAIIEWFVNNSCDNFLIIDDDARLNALSERFRKKLILTRSSIGLTTLDI